MSSVDQTLSAGIGFAVDVPEHLSMVIYCNTTTGSSFFEIVHRRVSVSASACMLGELSE